ncbi:unnamed protein product, partial [Anisakis simplex]|uniref:BAG domain-containing protein n=1 Tax=Anisakis simplex TaxID=6269 RepID=A0A0M3JMZ2_ANISI
MQNQRLQRTLEGLVGRLEMDDPTREGILKMLTSKTMELREESPKAGKKLQNKVKEQILAIKQFQ